MESFAESLPRSSSRNNYNFHIRNWKNNDNNDHSMWILRHDVGNYILIWSGLIWQKSSGLVHAHFYS